MLDDILAFAAATLVDEGRLAFWMPTSNEEAEEIRPPTHPCLEIVAVCSQDFNKCKLETVFSFPFRFLATGLCPTDFGRALAHIQWPYKGTKLGLTRERTGSRKLIAYRRRPDAEVDQEALRAWVSRVVQKGEGTTADELNPFRKMYFSKPEK
jgi:tRNA (guanine10-N2)-methyltransferase